jgi:hypothetical protein
MPSRGLGINSAGYPVWAESQTLSRYIYIAGEFGDEIAIAHSVNMSYTCPPEKKIIQDQTILKIVNRNGDNRRKLVIPKNEFKPFPKNQCPSPDFYRVFVCVKKIIMRWFDRDNVMSINLYSFHKTGPFLQRTFIKQLYIWKYNFRYHTLKDVRTDSINIFGCEKDGSFYFYTPQPMPAIRYFKRGVYLKPTLLWLSNHIHKLQLQKLRGLFSAFLNTQLRPDLIVKGLNVISNLTEICNGEPGSGEFVMDSFRQNFYLFINNAGHLIAWWWPHGSLDNNELFVKEFYPIQSVTV